MTALQRFMNKFHLIKTGGTREEATKVAKELSGKVIAFKNADVYAKKLIPGLQQ